MTNFEKIDDYLSNRLSDSEKATFENQLEGDPALKEEFDFQQQISKGIQQARIAELKQMMTQVPVGGASMSTGQIAATVLSASVVLFSLYFFLRPDQPPSPEPEFIPELATEPASPEKTPVTETEVKEIQTTDEDLNKDQPSKEAKATSPVKKPAIQVVDPSDEFKETEEPSNVVTPGRSEIQPSKLEVITDSSDKKHSFHYQFNMGKLQLFGPFDNNLYEILEIHGESHAVFLYYKEHYYLLDEGQNEATQLVPIRDGKLLHKLREYRGR